MRPNQVRDKVAEFVVVVVDALVFVDCMGLVTDFHVVVDNDHSHGDAAAAAPETVIVDFAHWMHGVAKDRMVVAMKCPEDEY